MIVPRVSNDQGIANLCNVALHLLQTMEVNAATKFAVRVVLREAVNKSRKNYRGNSNQLNATHCSVASRNPTAGPLVADHAIPISLMLQHVYEDRAFDGPLLVQLCQRYSTLVLITRDEDRALTNLGLKKSMPKAWNGCDTFARYIAAGIEILETKSG